MLALLTAAALAFTALTVRPASSTLKSPEVVLPRVAVAPLVRPLFSSLQRVTLAASRLAPRI